MISSLCQRRIFRYNNNNNNKTPFIKTNKKKKVWLLYEVHCNGFTCIRSVSKDQQHSVLSLQGAKNCSSVRCHGRLKDAHNVSSSLMPMVILESNSSSSSDGAGA